MGDSFLLILGGMLLAGYAAHALGRRVHVPRVTLLLLLGLVCGPAVLGLVPASIAEWFPRTAQMALAMVGFLLGERFADRGLTERGPRVLGISVAETLASAGAVGVGAWLLGAEPSLALVLAGIAPATAPAATLDTVRESGAEGPVSDAVLGVVAIDDAWGVLIFSLLLVAGQAASGSAPALATLGSGLWELAGAVALGAMLGLPMAWLTGRLREGEPAVLEAMGFVFLCAGLAEILEVSYLLACMVLGAVVARRAHHHTRPVHAVEGVADPFLAIFFLVAGFKFELAPLVSLGGIGAAYGVTRSAAKVLAGRAGAALVHAPSTVRRHVGWCLLPQAGVALGLALLAEETLPELAGRVLPLVIATTVIFEITGPLVIRWRLRRAGEIP